MTLFGKLRQRAHAPGSLQLPERGDTVWVSQGRWADRAPGRVDHVRTGALGIAVTEALGSFGPRRKCEFEWIVADGLARGRGRITGVRAGPPPVLEIAVRGRPALVRRRADLRARCEFAVSGWSLRDPTRLLSGRTVDLSASGALLRLPLIPETAITVDLRIDLPDGALHAVGTIVRRAGDLVAVRLEPKAARDGQRLARFVSARLRAEGPARERSH